MLFPHTGGKNLTGSQILNGCQIPKVSLEFEKGYITDPNEMRGKRLFGNFTDQVCVAVVVRGDGTEVMLFPAGRFHPKELHDSFRPFVVNFEMERHFVLPIGRMVHKGIGNTFDEHLVFLQLEGMTVDILPGDPESICPDGLDGPVGNQLNFFSLDSSSA
jgi:hypothetical protein